MRGMSGSELHEELTVREMCIPVTISTGHGDATSAITAMINGPVPNSSPQAPVTPIQTVLTDPWRPAGLFSLISSEYIVPEPPCAVASPLVSRPIAILSTSARFVPSPEKACSGITHVDLRPQKVYKWD